jgi:hypothetical protein
MDEIRELQGRLAELSAEEFAKLTELVKAKAAEINDDDTSDEATSVLSELGDITDQIVAEKTSRETKAQEGQEAREAARARINAISGEEDEEETAEEPEKDEDEPEEEKDEPEAEATEEAETEEAPAEAVVASGKKGAVRNMAKRKPTPSPEAVEEPRGATLTASAGYQAGRPITDREDLAREFCQQLERMDRHGGSQGKVIVASMDWRDQYPEDRKIGGSVDEANAKIEAVCGRTAQKYDPDTGALVATGGICQPVNVDYTVPTWSTDERPIHDALPSFEATRGGIRFVQPPDIAEWEAATGIWTEATDAEPGSSTKPVKSLACGTEESAYVEAISTRIGFGNMQARFAPEQVAANTDMAMDAAARVAEVNLLNLIQTSCVKTIEFGKQLGLARDLLAQVDACLAAYQSIHRIPQSQAFTAIFPIWAKDMFRMDMLREQAHDNSGSFNVWEISDEQIDGFFKARNVNVIWHLDGQPTKGTTFYNQIMEVPGETAKFDSTTNKLWESAAKVVWYFFAEGQIQLLDAGRLDLGVVRDSTLDATNDYETFIEVFESIAFRGFAKGAWQLNSEVLASGATSLPTTGAAKNV